MGQLREFEPLLGSARDILASQYGWYGYSQVTALLHAEGCHFHMRVQWTWRREGLKVPARQPKRGWLWLNDGPCTRLRP